MDCTAVSRWFSPYLDGLLSAHERATLEHHVAECARCQADLESLKQMLASLRAMEQAEPPDLLPAIHARLAQPPWWERAAARFTAPWPASLPWHGLALAGSAAFIAILVVIPEYRLKVKAPASDSLGMQFSQVSSQARQDGEYRDADRLDVAKPVGDQMRAVNEPVEFRQRAASRRQEISGSRLPAADGQLKAASTAADEAPTTPLIVQWHVSDVADAALQVCGWVHAQQGECASTDDRRLSVMLPATSVPQFLQQFSTPREEANVASPPPAPASAPPGPVVAILLELVPSE